MAAGKQHGPLDPGSSAPAFRLALLAGGVATLDEILAEGGSALLAFFKVACPVCQFTFPFLERLRSAGKLAVYGVSQDDPQGTAEFNRRFGVTFPTLLDSEADGFPVSNAYGISSVPTLFLVEPGGAVSRVVEGWSRRDMEWLAERASAAIFRPGERVPEWKPG